MIYEKAAHVLEIKLGHTVELGGQWVYRFLQRHPQLGIYRATPLERSRANGMNPTAVKEYFDTVEELFAIHNPPDENILAMDEVGMNTGIFSRPLVIAQAGQRHQHLQRAGDRKITTVIETITGNGTTLRPTVIFKGNYNKEPFPTYFLTIVLRSLHVAIRITKPESITSRTATSRLNTSREPDFSFWMDTAPTVLFNFSSLRWSTISSSYQLHHILRTSSRVWMLRASAR